MSPKKTKMFDIIDTSGDGNKNDPRFVKKTYRSRL